MQNRWDKKKTQGTMVDLNPNKSVIRINANELNTPIKRQRLSLKKKIKLYAPCNITKR